MAQARVEVFQGADLQWYWREVAGNGQVQATGGEGFTRPASAINAAKAAFGEDAQVTLVHGDFSDVKGSSSVPGAKGVQVVKGARPKRSRKR